MAEILVRHHDCYRKVGVLDTTTGSVRAFDGGEPDENQVWGTYLELLDGFACTYSDPVDWYLQVGCSRWRTGDANTVCRYCRVVFVEYFSIRDATGQRHAHWNFTTLLLIRALRNPTYDGSDEDQDYFFQCVTGNFRRRRQGAARG